MQHGAACIINHFGDNKHTPLWDRKLLSSPVAARDPRGSKLCHSMEDENGHEKAIVGGKSMPYNQMAVGNYGTWPHPAIFFSNVLLTSLAKGDI